MFILKLGDCESIGVNGPCQLYLPQLIRNIRIVLVQMLAYDIKLVDIGQGQLPVTVQYVYE